MSCFIGKSAILFLFLSCIAFADDATYNIVMSQLSFIGNAVPYILGVIITISLIRITWDKVSDVLFGNSVSSGTFISNSKTRELARKRLSRSVSRGSRWIGQSSARRSSRFRRRFSKYEHFQGSYGSSFRKDGSLKSNFKFKF